MTIKREIREYFAEFGKQGGKARAKNMTAKERKDAARKAVEVRWAKQRKKLDEITKGTKALLKTTKANAKKANRKKAEQK